MIIIKNGFKQYDRLKSDPIASAFKRTDDFLKNKKFEKTESRFLNEQEMLYEEDGDGWLISQALKTRNFNELTTPLLQKCLDNAVWDGLPTSIAELYTLSPEQHCLFRIHLAWTKKHLCKQEISLSKDLYFSNAFKDNGLIEIKAGKSVISNPGKLSELLRGIEKTYGNRTERPSLIHAFNDDDLEIYDYLRDCGVSFDNESDMEIFEKIKDCYEWSTISEWRGEIGSLDESVIELVAGRELRESIRSSRFCPRLPV